MTKPSIHSMAEWAKMECLCHIDCADAKKFDPCGELPGGIIYEAWQDANHLSTIPTPIDGIQIHWMSFDENGTMNLVPFLHRPPQ